MGTADFNTIGFEEQAGVLTIECSFPVTLRLHVDALAVRLNETREYLGMAEYMTSGNALWATGHSGEACPRADRELLPTKLRHLDTRECPTPVVERGLR